MALKDLVSDLSNFKGRSQYDNLDTQIEKGVDFFPNDNADGFTPKRNSIWAPLPHQCENTEKLKHATYPNDIDMCKSQETYFYKEFSKGDEEETNRIYEMLLRKYKDKFDKEKQWQIIIGFSKCR